MCLAYSFDISYTWADIRSTGTGIECLYCRCRQDKSMPMNISPVSVLDNDKLTSFA